MSVQSVLRLIQIPAALVGGGTLAQFPEFYQQYLQRLAGRMDEVRQRAQEIANDAAAQGLDVQAYIARFLDSPAHALEGEHMAEALESAARLDAAYGALVQADAWQQLPLFLRHVDPALAHDAGSLFQPALSLTLAGLIYALAGAAIGIIAVTGCAKAIALMRQRVGKPTLASHEGEDARDESRKAGRENRSSTAGSGPDT